MIVRERSGEKDLEGSKESRLKDQKGARENKKNKNRRQRKQARERRHIEIFRKNYEAETNRQQQMSYNSSALQRER